MAFAFWKGLLPFKKKQGVHGRKDRILEYLIIIYSMSLHTNIRCLAAVQPLLEPLHVQIIPFLVIPHH